MSRLAFPELPEPTGMITGLSYSRPCPKCARSILGCLTFTWTDLGLVVTEREEVHACRVRPSGVRLFPPAVAREMERQEPVRATRKRSKPRPSVDARKRRV